MTTLTAGIIGGTGYTGAELLRLLVAHNAVELAVITSRSEAGNRVDAVYPNLRGYCDLRFSAPEEGSFSDCDVVFSATPNGVAMTHAHALLESGVKLIDLAADFRITDVAVWEQWYGMQHACPELLEQAVYGLPELNRTAIANADIVANPGCYPTATTLGFAPLLRHGLVAPGNLIADVKSGVSGAGRGASVANLFTEVSDSFKAYAASGHRHHPEIVQNLERVSDQPVALTFIPHLVPVLRGIHATLYADLLDPGMPVEEVQGVFEQSWSDEPFVDVMPLGSHPQTRSMRGSNYCSIALHKAAGSGKLVVLSAIDNLTKGAAGQAIQNMNIMFGLTERAGLESAGLQP